MAIKFLSDINADGSNTDINADGAIKISDTTILETNATYTMLSNPEGSRCLYLGDGGDRTSYYDNNAHRFRGAGGSGDKMFINGSGNVGIGNTSPSSKLHVSGDGRFGNHAIIGTAIDQGFYMDSSNGAYRANGTTGTRGFYFQTYNGAGTKMYVGLTGTYAGNVGINTTQPSQKLHVNGDTYHDGKVLIGTSSSMHSSADLQILGATGNYARIMMKDSDGTNQVGFIDKSGAALDLISQNGTSHGVINLKTFNGTTSTSRLHINSVGNVGIGTTSPGQKLEVNGNADITGRLDVASDLRLRGSGSTNDSGVVRQYVDSNNTLNIDAGNNASDIVQIQSDGDMIVPGDITMSSNTTLHIGNVDLTTGSGGNTVSVEAATSSGTAMNFKTSSGTVAAYMVYQGTTTTRFAGRVEPSGNRTLDLGTDALRWRVVYCETLDSAGQHESNLQDKEQPVGQYITGTVLSWKNGKNRPCTQFADHMRMGIAVLGQDSPLVQGAEPVLCTGIVEEGDYLVTSEKEGHAVAVPRHIVKEQLLFDCVIGKALQDGEGESHLIKTWINI